MNVSAELKICKFKPVNHSKIVSQRGGEDGE